MALLRFFKLPKNQKFDYKPRYWNPEKEALEERLKKDENNTEAVKARLARGGFKSRYSNVSFQEKREIRAKELKRSNRRLIIIMLVLIFLGYLLFEAYLPEIVQATD